MPRRKKSQERIIQERIRQFIDRSQKKNPIEFATYLVVHKGDIVPSEFRGLPQIKVNAKGIAKADYSDGWCQSAWDKSTDWDNAWGECWDNSGPANEILSGLYEAHLDVRRISLESFSLAERATLLRYGIMK